MDMGNFSYPIKRPYKKENAIFTPHIHSYRPERQESHKILDLLSSFTGRRFSLRWN